MWLLSAPRRRSWAWRGMFAFALLMIGVYVLFDILDVDGSQMTDLPERAVIMAETVSIDSDRLFRADLLISDLAKPLNLFLSQYSSTESRSLSPVPAIPRDRLRRILPRGNPYREMARVSLSSSDPA